ncbi:hypothetical protein [Amycolatopsis sp. NPDC059657]|uniref:hypothetical protein n=1 Tax=Amycolatopsis sp. NPDC059657 TaxID=3346899 RepID=UPI00366D470B
MSTGAEPEFADISLYLTEHGLEPAFGFQLVPYLAQRGLMNDVSTLGCADAIILPDGIVAVQALQAARADPANRAASLRKEMLLWLDEHEEGSSGYGLLRRRTVSAMTTQGPPSF